MSDELHKDVLKLLGAGVKRLPSRYYKLTFNGVKYGRDGIDEADAWAQAPTLEVLMPSLMLVMCNDDVPFWVTITNNSDGWRCGLRDAGGLMHLNGVGESMPEATATLFIAVFKAGHIDPKTVVLP